ncbi:MAG: DUF835 domain-containing protein [Thermoplasmata archaeon]|nr:DUF835 domain-containing protein [Thermoplasmata archaeon]
MVAVLWIASLIAGAICLGAGLLALMSNPRSSAAMLFLFAMWSTFVALVTGAMYPLIEPAKDEVARTVGMTFVFSVLLSETFLWQLTMVFPQERKITFRPLNRFGLMMIAGVVVAITLGSLVEIEFVDGVEISSFGTSLMVLYPLTMMIIAMAFIVTSRGRSSAAQRRSGFIYLAGLWIFALSAVPYLFQTADGVGFDAGDLSIASLSIVMGIALSGLVFAISIASGQMVLREPTMEATISSTKAAYELLHRRVYLVEEEKSSLSFEMFVDILRGRCFDCENDESFPCESLDCSSCGLPCPCRECTKYTSRAQGLIVTRKYPNDLRSEMYLQTTPIIWLSTVAGKDNLDPAKLSLLTDMLVSFMERSENGVVLIDGIEYLVTSTDFQRTLKATERWTETAMANATKLIISVDPRAFDMREMAMLEKNKEVITPDRAHRFRST